MSTKFNSLFFFFIVTGLLSLSFNGPENEKVISLAGQWKYRLDPNDKGENEKWYLQKFDKELQLPGSLNEQNIGNPITLTTKWTGSIYDSSFYFHPRLAKYRQPNNIKIPFWLTPKKHYVGAVWYQKEVIVPEKWKHKRISLFLERAHTETVLFVDDKQIGMQNSLVAPHVYTLEKPLKPGKHTITLRIDNRVKEINVGPDSHSITDHTQGNWNGVVGKIELQAKDLVSITNVQVYPQPDKKMAIVKVALNADNFKQKGTIHLEANSFNSTQPKQKSVLSISYNLKKNQDTVSIELPMGDDFLWWDEFNPALYELKVNTLFKNEQDTKTVTFGMRKFETRGKDFYINNRPVFLRGTAENCVFPLTGYAPMDEEAWIKVFKICKSFGLNHMRFHSYCPPEAAFKAADKMGFYLQPEGPSWANHGSSLGNGKPIDQYIYDETNRMDDFYGNYASFCMMAYGNEPSGKQVEYLTKFNEYWKAKDARKLYTGASVGGSWPVIPNNEFMVRAGARGLAWNKLPESESTYEKQITQFKVPFVAHEMGQYCVFPDFTEIPKYRGAFQAKNLELFKEDLADHHMLNQANDFLMASGKLQLLCYKNEIEKALRTPGYSGFQLLGLNDYSGQGTALVGVLNAFWEEKGYASAKDFTRFCNTTVALTQVPKFIYHHDEVFNATVDVSHYGEKPLINKTVLVTLKTDDGEIIFTQRLNNQQINYGFNHLGKISFPLKSITQATKLTYEISIEATSFSNNWNIWVYPSALPTTKPSFYYTTVLDEQAKKVLHQGGNVFLNASGSIIKGKEVIQNFTPVFWNTSWFKMRPPHTLGILLNPKHPAYHHFPTDYHSDIQWWEIVNKTQVMHLEDFPVNFKPLIQPIDTWFMNRRLAMLFEAKVGNGKIIVSSANLSPQTGINQPAARQLFYSLQRYMQSADFKPEHELDIHLIEDIFKTSSKQVFDTYTKDSPDELKPKIK
jgi:hypothetical protein